MSVDVYVRLAKPANPPRDLSCVWANLNTLEDAPDVVLGRVEWWAHSKGSSLPTLARMNVRYRVNRHGGVHIAYAVRCAQTEALEAGTVVGVKFRDLDSEAPRVKFCAPGTRLKFPALPSLYGCADARRLFVCEGESDAAWLLERCDDDGAVLCLHGGAALFSAEWLELVPDGADVLVATDNDWDRPRGNIGEQLAQRILAQLPSARRLRPPFPAKDWCEVTS
jgi:hypothetical protein